MTIQSTISDSEYYYLEEDDAESDPNRNPKVVTYTTNSSPHKLLTNREIPAIIQGVIPPVNQTTTYGVATSTEALHAVRAVLHKDIVTSATRSTTDVLKDPLGVNWKDASRPIPVDKKTVGIPPITTSQVLTGTGPSDSAIRIGRQKIEGTRWSIIMQEDRNAELIDASIHQFLDKHRDPTPGWSKIIGSKVVTDESANVYVHRRMNFGSDTVLSKNTNFKNFWMSHVNTIDKLGSVIVPTTRFGRPTNGYNWLQPGKLY